MTSIPAGRGLKPEAFPVRPVKSRLLLGIQTEIFEAAVMLSEAILGVEAYELLEAFVDSPGKGQVEASIDLFH